MNLLVKQKSNHITTIFTISILFFRQLICYAPSFQEQFVRNYIISSILFFRQLICYAPCFQVASTVTLSWVRNLLPMNRLTKETAQCGVFVVCFFFIAFTTLMIYIFFSPILKQTLIIHCPPPQKKMSLPR